MTIHMAGCGPAVLSHPPRTRDTCPVPAAEAWVHALLKYTQPPVFYEVDSELYGVYAVVDMGEAAAGLRA